MRRQLCVLVVALVLGGCGGSSSLPSSGSRGPGGDFAPQTVNRLSAGTCRVSADGAIWYQVSAGTFAPLVAAQNDCPGERLDAAPLSVPSWAIPRGPTQTLFAAASLARDARLTALDGVEHAAGAPVTWLLEQVPSAGVAAAIDAGRASGDDAQAAPEVGASVAAALPWYRPSVAVLGAGRERDIAGAIAAGDRAFWGITWDSAGTDGTYDRGAPWGFYCADPLSYKRPARDGTCALGAIEWTARDLTAAYESGREAAFSTDPEDLRLRALLDPATAAAYGREMVDAYAAAGETQPLLMVAQEESDEFADAQALDTPIVSALATQARSDGMGLVTFAEAAARLAAVPQTRRAVAFPALPLAGRYGPGTIDAHDDRIGLTFLAGSTMPSRVIAYDRETSSLFGFPVPTLAPSEMPSLLGAAAAGGVLTLRFHAPIATRFGVAFWSDPAAMGWSSPEIVPAARAGAVAFFDLAAGDDTVTLRCAACSSTTFPYAT